MNDEKTAFAILFLQARYSKTCAKYSVLDKLLLDDLTGKLSDPFSVFKGLISDENHLLASAKSQNSALLIMAIHHCRFYRAFYRGDYAEAEKNYESISLFPITKRMSMTHIHWLFYRGLIAFQMYREGQGEDWQRKGKLALDKMELWLENSESIFENKVLLLQAENHASMCEVAKAKAMYKAAIKSARDHGLVHQQGLAYEFMGNYLASIVETSEATCCYKNAYECYMQWGAVVKAERLWKDHTLDQRDKIDSSAVKNGRDWSE